MTKRFVSQVSFYFVAVVLGMYLSNGLSLTSHVVYVSVSVFATFMSQRRQAPVTATVSRLPDTPPNPDELRIVTIAHVEDLLSHAS